MVGKDQEHAEGPDHRGGDGQVGAGPCPVGQDPQRQERGRGVGLAEQEQPDCHDPADDRYDDSSRGPAVANGPAAQEDHRRQRTGDQHAGEEVDRRAPPRGSRRQDGTAGKQRADGDRDVHVETPPPVQVLRQRSTEEQPRGCPTARNGTVDPEGAGAFSRVWKGDHDHRQGRRREQGGEGSLQGPSGHQYGEAGRRARERGRRRKPLRADARRNHRQILTAARDVFVERGPNGPLDEIARRAGVGIGTLYRRFADRPTLMRTVVLDAVTQTAEVAERALADEPDAFAALTTYMHAVLDPRVSAVIPVLLDHVELDDEELGPARERGARALERIVEAAHAAGSLDADVTVGDIGLMLVRLSRPLPGPIPAELNAKLAHRHLDLLINGLRTVGAEGAALGGPALTFQALHALCDAQGQSTATRASPAESGGEP